MKTSESESKKPRRKQEIKFVFLIRTLINGHGVHWPLLARYDESRLASRSVGVQTSSSMNARVFLLLLALYRVNAQGSGYSAGGWVPPVEKYKWVVAIYKNKDKEGFQHICGGSLVRDDVVLSAAHCFTNGGNKIPAENFRVTAGNHYRDINHSEDKQVLEVEEILVHERYRGQEFKLANDIALVKLKKRVDLFKSSLISIDFRTDFDDDQLRGQVGTVVGWGFTELDVPSETRMAVNLPYVDFDKCLTTVPRMFRTYITPDKFCAGLLNGTSVCPGDSGGGLAFQKNGAWYVRGIVSVAPQPKGISQCHTTQFSAFTSVNAYVSWLEHKLADLEEDKLAGVEEDISQHARMS